MLSLIDNQIKDFLKDDFQRNCWIFDEGFKAYLRKSNRNINGIIIKCLDIASIEIIESERGKGIFKCFLKKIVTVNDKIQIIYVENILNPLFLIYFKKNSNLWTLDNKSTLFSPSYYCFTDNLRKSYERKN